VDTQFETFQAILPGMKSVLLLLGAGNPSAEIDRNETKEVCGKLGLTYNEKVVKDTKEALAAVNEFQGKVSMMIIGNQSIVIDIAKDLVAAAGKTPVVSYSSKPVKDGALGGFVADDETLGYMLAKSVLDVLIKGKAVKDIPVKVDPNPKFYVNVKTAQSLGIEVPYEVLQAATVIE
jgi:putative ABC transport system substrate-binding protein